MTVRKKEKERKGTGLAHSAENSGLISPWRVAVMNFSSQAAQVLDCKVACLPLVIRRVTVFSLLSLPGM